MGYLRHDHNAYTTRHCRSSTLSNGSAGSWERWSVEPDVYAAYSVGSSTPAIWKALLRIAHGPQVPQ